MAVKCQFRVNQSRFFALIESALCDFVLMINSNLGPILHYFGDTAVLSIRTYYIYPTLI